MESSKSVHGSTWSREEVLTLIIILRDEKIHDQRDNCARKEHVCEIMANRLDKEVECERTRI